MLQTPASQPSLARGARPSAGALHGHGPSPDTSLELGSESHLCQAQPQRGAPGHRDKLCRPAPCAGAWAAQRSRGSRIMISVFFVIYSFQSLHLLLPFFSCHTKPSPKYALWLLFTLSGSFPDAQDADVN